MIYQLSQSGAKTPYFPLAPGNHLTTFSFCEFEPVVIFWELALLYASQMDFEGEEQSNPIKSVATLHNHVRVGSCQP